MRAALSPRAVAALFLAGGIFSDAATTTNSVSNVGTSAYSINGMNNPTLTLMRGVTYLFHVNASGHPFWIKTVASTGTGNAYSTGVTNNGVQAGTLTFHVPTNAPGTLHYNCQFHTAMTGTLNIIDAPSPPTVQIVSITVEKFVKVASTGAAGWSPVPEYCCDVPLTNWTPIANFTNVFASGTNTSTFDLLDPVTCPRVFIRVMNKLN